MRNQSTNGGLKTEDRKAKGLEDYRISKKMEDGRQKTEVMKYVEVKQRSD